MKIDWKRLIISLIISLGTGGLSALLISDNISIYKTINKPPFAPPAILFPVVWTLLYLLMGISSYLIWTAKNNNQEKANALFVYGIHLAVNFLWPIIFFNLRAFLFAFIWILLLLFLIITVLILFKKISKTAALLLLPYLAWVTFATYLNLAIFILN
ncbi:MAG: TspO/MBR family protein [bacterium]|nr:TspO/MBR family protein [bacterium]